MTGRTKAKTQIVFDENDRAKYLLGFRKRKMERKVKAREDLDAKIKAEKQRQRELRNEAMDEERGKYKVPTFENKLTKREVIETPSHTIVVSDLSTAINYNKFTDDEDDDIRQSVAKDAVITKSKAKISKEIAMLEDSLAKLEKQKKKLQECKSKTKMKKLLKKSRQSSKGVKATKKHQIKETKIKTKTQLKKQKRIDKGK